MLSVAPMIGWTDRHYRFLMRQLTRETLLYTEMVMDAAVVHNVDRLQDFIGHRADVEYPLALQLGGCCPELLGQAVEIAQAYGNFSEINLNSGCPSNKAKKAGFGAELMLDTELVRRIVYEMNRRSNGTKITVKCRLGTNRLQGWDHLCSFVDACRAAGSHDLVVHARICILNGLTPAQNRTIPPLNYEMVHALAKHFPDMKFTLNGGIKDFATADLHLGRCNVEDMIYDTPVHAVMIGREAYNNPWIMADADRYFYGKVNMQLSRWDALERYFDYCEAAQESCLYGSSTPLLCKPLHNFFHGSPENKMYKFKLDQIIKERPNDSVKNIMLEALEETINRTFLEGPTYIEN
jgi:tRNA-dihydrouridine synthase A